MEDAKGGGDCGGNGGGAGLVAWLRRRPDERLGELAPIAGELVGQLHCLGSSSDGCPGAVAAEDAPAEAAAARRALAVLCEEARCGSLHAALDPAAAGGSGGAVAFVRAIAFSRDLRRLWRCLVLSQPWPEDHEDDGDHDRQLGRNPHAGGPAVGEAPLALTSDGDWRRDAQPWHEISAEPALPLLKAALLAAPAASLGNLLASATAASYRSGSSGSLEAVAWVLRSMAASGRGPAVAREWAAAWAALVCAAGDDEALARVVAMRWLLTAALLPEGDHAVDGSGDRADAGRVLKGPIAALMAELQTAWPALLALLRRPGCHALHMEVLELVAALDDAAPPRLQAAAARLQATLGLLFSCLPAAADEVPAASWPAARACERLRRLAVRLAAGGGSHTLTMLVGHALDRSFELAAAGSNPEQAPMAVQPHGRPALAAAGAAVPGAATLCGAHGHLEADGNLALPHGGGLALPPQGTAVVGLLGENRKRRRLSPLLSAPLAGGRSLSPSTTEAADDGLRSHCRTRAQNDAAVDKLAATNDGAFVELTSVVRAALHLASKAVAERRIGLGGGAAVPEWHLPPVGVLCSQLAARMDLPHEPPMTMEEYEQVLPRKVTSARHNILAAACRQNPFLFQLLALAAEQGPSPELLRCAELLRVLLADAISSWHSLRRSSEARTAQGQRLTVEERRAEELLRLVGRAGWLPRPLASCAELVALVDSADVPDLLMLAWRCMHHAMAFGPHSWGSRHRSPGFSSAIQQLAPTNGGQVELLAPSLPAAPGPGSEEPAAAAAATLGLEAEEDLTFTEWEGHLFAILRRNIAHIGAHFAQIFPV
eukprot:SM000029S10450  [mRNA]  locus=s29:212610:217369:+ [translate_table: standard]